MKIEHTLIIKAEGTSEMLLLSKTRNADTDCDCGIAYKKLTFMKDIGILTIIAEGIDGRNCRSTHSIKWEKIGHPFVNPFDIFFYLPSGLADISIGARRNGKRLELTAMAEDISNFVLTNPAV